MAGKQILIKAAELISALGSIDEQREMFLLKFKDVDRKECEDLATDFKRFDTEKKGELTEHQALMLLEHRDAAKTATELRQLLTEMDVSKNKKLSFVELSCSLFNKPFDDLDNFVDEEAKEQAKEEARKQAEKVKAVEEENKRLREEEEAKAAERAAILEAESKLTGVAGMKAFFFRQAEATHDITKTNEQKIKEEAAMRKQMKDEKEKLKKAVEEANKVKTADDLIREVGEAAAKIKADEEAVIAAKLAEEKRIRAEKTAVNNAKWAGLSSPSKPNVK